MFVLLCGTGVGFSVERQYVSKMPEVPDTIYKSETCVVVSDSKEGWAKSLRQVIALLYAGEIPTWNVSKVRPAGARLKTFGGRASGPEPLVDLFKFVIDSNFTSRLQLNQTRFVSVKSFFNTCENLSCAFCEQGSNIALVCGRTGPLCDCLF